MTRLQHVACMTALALAFCGTVPTARAADDGSDSTLNANVTIGLLCVVVGILVYVGWQSDREDKEYRASRSKLLPLLADEGRQLGFYVDDEPRGEVMQVAGGLAFRADF